MAQGQIKKTKAAVSNGRRPSVLGPKKGARTIAPKKATLVKQKRITKKHSAGLTAQTERNLAEKAGHLELLAGGKNKKKGKDKEKDTGKAGGGEKSTK